MTKDTNETAESGIHFGKTFGALVRHKRGQLGWSQETLAEVALQDPMRKGMISILEGGKIKAPHQRTVERLARALNISPAEIEACRSHTQQSLLSNLSIDELHKTQRFETEELWEVRRNLGLALQAQARTAGDLKSLQKAIKAFDSALDLVSREKQPKRWASIQHNLGLAFEEYAMLSGDPKFLKKAIEALQKANDALM